MLHTISGSNFHGHYSVQVRAPKDGGSLSTRVAQRILRELCHRSDCTCGGGYGTGPDSHSAQWYWRYSSGHHTMTLVPAGAEMPVAQGEYY